jgi:hypothetical protein
VLMDWGLGRREYGFLGPSLMYPRRYYYFAVIAIDLGRCLIRWDGMGRCSAENTSSPGNSHNFVALFLLPSPSVHVGLDLGTTVLGSDI